MLLSKTQKHTLSAYNTILQKAARKMLVKLKPDRSRGQDLQEWNEDEVKIFQSCRNFAQKLDFEFQSQQSDKEDVPAKDKVGQLLPLEVNNMA